MGKRSDYERVERDFYPTPWQAVEPLVSHLPKEFAFAEPGGGDGALVNHIETLIEGAWCSWVSDIEPQKKGIHTKHFRDLGEHEFLEADYIITNPPWDRKLLHPMIEYFTAFRPTWLLFDADWIHTDSKGFFKPLDIAVFLWYSIYIIEKEVLHERFITTCKVTCRRRYPCSP